MTLLPVVARELRVASRRAWTYWGRVAAGGTALVLSTWLTLVTTALGSIGNGEPLFYALSVPALGFTFLAGVLHAADSISGERRDGTLGLLFLTDLRGIDVTLGKLAGNSLGAIYGLVAMLPFLALTLLLGGVTGADYARMILVLLTTLFASLATGLLASVLTVEVRRSVLMAFVLMLAVFLGMPALCGTGSWALHRYSASAEAIEWWETGWHNSLSPAIGFGFAGSTRYATGSGRYWISIAYTACAGLASLWLASGWLPHTWREPAQERSRSGFDGWLQRLRFTNPESLTQYRRSILELNPVTWLSARHWTRPWLPWLFLIAVAALAAWIQDGQDADWWDVEASFTLSILVHAALKLWVANEAPRQFLDDRRTGALELLLSTPLTTGEILGGQGLALRRQFLGPTVLVLIVDLYWMTTAGFDAHRNSSPPILAILWLLRMILLPLDLWTLGWTGFWAGMTGRGRATTTSLVVRILILPWILWFLAATVLWSFAEQIRGPDEDLLMWLVIASWFVLASGSDLFWVVWARASLSRSFRDAATRHPGESRRWFQRHSQRSTGGKG